MRLSQPLPNTACTSPLAEILGAAGDALRLPGYFAHPHRIAYAGAPDSRPASLSSHADSDEEPRYGERRKADEHGD